METESSRNVRHKKILEGWAMRIFKLFAAVLLSGTGLYLAGYGTIAKYMFVAAFIAIIAAGILIAMSAISALNAELRGEDLS